jgi:starvation-inducible outer membrane lipoprotein
MSYYAPTTVASGTAHGSHAMDCARKWSILLSGLVALLTGLGCNKYDVIPDYLEPQLAPDLTYETVRAAPKNHQGKLVAWGGEVIAATRTKEGTTMEILQLPLTDDFYPTEERVRSKGRFIAFDMEGTITDPAAVEPGTPVTIIGRIGPAQHEELQGVDYDYPRVDVVDMTVWVKKVVRGWHRLGAWGGGWQYDPRPWTLYRSYRVD